MILIDLLCNQSSDSLSCTFWHCQYHKLVQWKEDHNGDTLVQTSKDSSDDVKKLAKW